jgi:signal peptidase II
MAKETKLMKKEDFKYTMKGSSLWGVLLFVILLLIDQVTKLVADAYFSAEGAKESIKIIPGWIELCQHYNKGVAFSGLNDAAPWVKVLLIVGTGVLMALFAVFYFKTDKRRSFLRLAVVFIVAGGVGNLIDRLYYRVWETDCLFGVRDMVDLSRFGFAVCNFADFFICIGAVVMVLALLFFDRDALCPLGKKYKTLAKEEDEKQNAKKQLKEAKKQAKNG